VPVSVAERTAHLSPVSTLFAAFLGYDPIQHLIGAHTLSQLPLAQQKVLTGRAFFPGLISAPFRAGLHAAFDFAIVASLLAAAASWLRGGKYVYTEPDRRRGADDELDGGADEDEKAATPDRQPLPVGATDDVSASSIAQVEAR
jgi:hypothetical protein